MLRCTGSIGVQKQAVDDRARTADVGAKRAQPDQLLGKRRAGKIVPGQEGKIAGATHGRKRFEQCSAAACVSALALARVEGRVHIGGRSLLDAGRKHEQDPVILRQVERGGSFDEPALPTAPGR